MENSQENTIVIICEHRPSQRTETREMAITEPREMKICVRYDEYERRIICGEEHVESTSSSPYNRTSFRVLGQYNPVDCELCKSQLMEFLKSKVFHPNPEQVLQDMYVKVSILRDRFEPKKNRFNYSTVYEIVNHIERHNNDNDNEKDWLITWVDYREEQQHHPLPPRAMEPVKVGPRGQSTEVEGFTCAICLEGVDRKEGKKRKRSNENVVRLLTCKHMFHEICIDQWVKDRGHNTCPLCRFRLPRTSRCQFHWDLAKKKALDNCKIAKIDFDKLCN